MTRHPVSLGSCLVNRQKVSPAHAPSAVMTVGSKPSRKSRAEQLPASGAQTPRTAFFFTASELSESGWIGMAESADPAACCGGPPSMSPLLAGNAASTMPPAGMNDRWLNAVTDCQAASAWPPAGAFDVPMNWHGLRTIAAQVN